MASRIYLANGGQHDIPDGRPAPQLEPCGALTVQEYGRRITYSPYAWTRLIEDIAFEE